MTEHARLTLAARRSYRRRPERTDLLLKLRQFVTEESGQNLVEFALLLPVLMYILMGIMQFGLIFAAYITINNAVREGARWGTIAVYDTSGTSTSNDAVRHNGIRDRIISGRGILNIPAVGSSNTNFNSGAGGSPTTAWPTGVLGDCFSQSPVPTIIRKNGDFTICYTKPTDVNDNDARRGYYMEVTAWYHQAVFVPLLDAFLPDDASKTGADRARFMRLPGRVTVVIN